MSTKDVGPALTPEEWKEWLQHTDPDPAFLVQTADLKWADEQPRHVVAARALHGQSFGFTHEDIRRLKHVLYDLKTDMDRGPEGIEVHLQPTYDALSSLRDRISALLPPKDAAS